MKHAMGVVVALALGVGLAGAAQAHGINRQSAMPSPNMQTGSTEQMQQSQIRPQRQAVRQKIGQSRKVATNRTRHLKGKMAAAKLNRHTRMAAARLQHKPSKTRIATLHRQKQNQTVGVGSSMPANNNGTGITPTIPNSAGGNQNLNSTQPQNQ